MNSFLAFKEYKWPFIRHWKYVFIQKTFHFQVVGLSVYSVYCVQWVYCTTHPTQFVIKRAVCMVSVGKNYTGSLWSYSESVHGLWALQLLTGNPCVKLTVLQTQTFCLTSPPALLCCALERFSFMRIMTDWASLRQCYVCLFFSL